MEFTHYILIGALLAGFFLGCLGISFSLIEIMDNNREIKNKNTDL